MSEKVKMRCLIGSIGLQDFTIVSNGEVFEIEEETALNLETERYAERVIEPVKEAKKKGTKIP